MSICVVITLAEPKNFFTEELKILKIDPSWYMSQETLTGNENQMSHRANQKTLHPTGSSPPLLHSALALNCFLQSTLHLGCPSGFSCQLLVGLSAWGFSSPGLLLKSKNHLGCCCFFFFFFCWVLLIWVGLWCSGFWEGGRMKVGEQLWKPWEWKQMVWWWAYMLKGEKDTLPLVFVAENSENRRGICLFPHENWPTLPVSCSPKFCIFFFFQFLSAMK